MSRTRHSTEESKTENADAESKGRAYAFSEFGILRLMAAILSLSAFICSESTPWCKGETYCTLPAYASTYVYFSIITFATFIFSAALYLLCYTGAHVKLPCAYQRKILIELVYLGLNVLLLAFGNAFMISRTGNRITYITATILGCLAMCVIAVHLSLLMIRFRFLLPLRNSESQGESIENIDFQTGMHDVTDITHPAASLNLTSMRARTDSPYSERLQPFKRPIGNNPSECSFEAVNVSGSARNGNLNQQENITLNSNSTFSSDSDAEVKGEWVVS